MARTWPSIALLLGLGLGGAMLAGAARTQPERAEPEAGVHASSIPIVGISGVGSRVKEAGWVRVTTPDALRELWSEHTGGASDAPQPPTVDFERCVVIAYFDPRIGNASGVHIESITPCEHDVRVQYDVVQYQTASFGGGEAPSTAKNSPFGFFVIDRYEGRMLFDEDVQHLLNEPPAWTLRWAIQQSADELQRSLRAQSGGR